MKLAVLRNRIFYAAKPLIPRKAQLFLRRKFAQYNRRKYTHVWPIDPRSAAPPKGWPGWPEGKHFGFVLSHDVDTRKGYDKVLELAELEEKMGFRSQFNFVPERYGPVDIALLNELKGRGFGIGVHGLKHDGKLFNSETVFKIRATLINQYLRSWGTKGFTTPSMICNHAWMHELDITHCISTFDTDPFEPQSEGAGTIFPYFVKRKSCKQRLVELPYTLVQDFTLFVILGEKTTDIWRKKIDWIFFNGGMALLNSHPDYMNFGLGKLGLEEYPIDLYIGFLNHVQDAYAGKYWHALPQSVADFVEYNDAIRNTRNQGTYER